MTRDDDARLLALYPVVHHALRQRFVPDPGGGRLSPHQATVLAHLDRAISHTLTGLAGEIGVALPTMSLLIDRLVRQGYVRRERDAADRRRVALRLTGSGLRAATARSLLDPSRVRAVLDLLTPEERTASLDGLANLARAARRLHPQASSTEESP